MKNRRLKAVIKLEDLGDKAKETRTHVRFTEKVDFTANRGYKSQSIDYMLGVYTSREIKERCVLVSVKKMLEGWPKYRDFYHGKGNESIYLSFKKAKEYEADQKDIDKFNYLIVMAKVCKAIDGPTGLLKKLESDANIKTCSDGYYQIIDNTLNYSMSKEEAIPEILGIIKSGKGVPVSTADIARALFGSDDFPYQNKTYPFVEDLRDDGEIVGTIKRERGKDLGSPWLLKEEDSLSDESSAAEGEEKVPSAKAEGEHRHVTLSQIKRDPGLRKRKIADARKNNPQNMLACDICGVTEDELRDRYPSGFHPEMAYEVHHIDPLAERGESAETELDEVAVLCANCHCMVHIDKEHVKENFEVLQKHFDKQRGKK